MHPDLGSRARRFSLPSAGKRWTLNQPDPTPLLSTTVSHDIAAKTTAAMDNSTEFDWSPVNKPASSLNSSFSPRAKERQFNIITGQRKEDTIVNYSNQEYCLNSKKQYNSFTYGENDFNILSKIKADRPIESHSESTRAPHLNLRRNAKTGQRHWDTELYQPTSSHVTSSGGGSVRYSRHTGGASIVSQSRNEM